MGRSALDDDQCSARPGLLHVYEPGWEDMVLEPGRSWAPTRHRWSYGMGRPGHLFQVVCSSDDHRDHLGTARDDGPGPVDEGDNTALLPAVTGPLFTPLERDVLKAYYSDFASLPRPAVLEPASHRLAARRLGRSMGSARKAVERTNEKISRAQDPPWAATGRNVSGEIGRWLARAGALDPVEPSPS